MEIKITDYGVGFPLECMDDIGAFNQFNRKKMEQQGSGLGLITSMLIVQRYKGSVKITNNKFGSTVLVALPVA
jgi:two-component system sensor kinase